jgi:hypothetical protein
MISGKKSAAMHILKSRKVVEKMRDQRAQSAFNLESVLMRIEESRGDLRVLEAYKLGAKVLRDTREQFGLTVDKIDEVMDSVQENMQESLLVDQAISQGNDSLFTSHAVDDDDADIEEEFAKLLQSEIKVSVSADRVAFDEEMEELERLQRVRQQLADLPTAPSSVQAARNDIDDAAPMLSAD